MADERVRQARAALRRRPRAGSKRDRHRGWARDGPKICLRIYAKQEELERRAARLSNELRDETRDLERLRSDLHDPVRRLRQQWPTIADSADVAVTALIAGEDLEGLDGPMAALGLLQLLDARYAELKAVQEQHDQQRTRREAEQHHLATTREALESEIADIKARIPEQQLTIASLQAQLEGAQASLSARWSDCDEAWQQVIEQLRWRLHSGERTASLAHYRHVRDVTGRTDHEFEAELGLDLATEEAELPHDIQTLLDADRDPLPGDYPRTPVNRALEDLTLSARVKSALRNAGIVDEAALRATDIDELGKIRGIGESALAEIHNVIEGQGDAP